MKRISVLLAVGLVVLVIGLGTGLAQDDEDATAAVNFVVLRDYNGKPVRNAGVVMHPVDKKGRQERGGLELKTDAEGKTSYDGVPYGKLRVQVLAPGFQTFGQDYEVHQPQMEITVKLKRPQGQYSIYEDHPGDKKDDNSQQSPPDQQKPDQKPQ
jgi:hypothetical protein